MWQSAFENPESFKSFIVSGRVGDGGRGELKEILYIDLGNEMPRL